MSHKVSKITHLFALSLLLPLLAVFSSCREEEPMPVAVESVELNEYYLTLKVGERVRLKATVYPTDAADQRVVWESYDSDIADVDEHGYVTAYEEGSTIVCVQTVDGSYFAECQVEVLSNEIRVEGIRLSDDSITMNVGDEHQLTAEISPSNATNKKLVWKSSNTSVATVNKGKVKAIKSGNSTITVSAEDGELSASCAVTVEEIEEPKSSWGLVGTFNNWGKSGNDIPMSDERSDNYYVATEVSLNKSDSFAFRYDNDWGQSRGGASTGGNGSTIVFKETFAGCDGVMGWSGNVANGNFATDNDGWTVENAHGADGAAKFGASSKRGSAQTPALNFTGNATLTFKAGAWSGDQTTLNITMTGGTLSKSSITLSNGYWSEYEISITGATKGAKIKFEGVQTNKARFFLDDIKIIQAGGGNEGVFDINEKYSTVTYDDDSRISVASTGTYDIYLAKSLDYFYVMSKGQKPDDDAGSSNISVTGVTLNKTSLSLTAGDTYTLSCTVRPSNASDKSVTWKSSNTSVASVNSSGKVTAIKEGTAVITVKTNDGGYTAECEVSVSNQTISVTSVTLNKTSLSLAENETYTLTYTVKPSNASDKSVTWKSSNTSIATVTNSGKVTAIKKGNAVITVKTNDGGYTAECEVTVSSQSVEDKITLTSSSSNNVSYEANDYAISFSSANAWNASSDSDWITINPDSGTSGNNSISVQIAKNTSTAKRTGNVTITSGTASAKISYTQDGATNTGGDGGNADPDDCNKISLKVDMNTAFNFNWSDAEWEDYLNKSYTSSNMTGYGADYKCVEYDNGWITICFDGDVTTIPGVLTYASYAEAIVLPNSVMHIGDNAFANHNKCTAINIPTSLQTIGREAFAYVTCIKGLVLLESVVSIGQSAFFGCTNITSVKLSSSLNTISTQAFSASGLTEISIPSSVHKIEMMAFHGCTNLKKVKVGNNVQTATTEIEENVFGNCSSLTDVIIGSEVKIIGSEVFKGCNNLINVTLGGNISRATMEIGAGAFANCTSLRNLTWGSEVNIIAGGAFSSCTSLQSVTLPGTVSSIGEQAFENCSSLKSLVIGDDDTSHGTVLNSSAFKGCSSLQNTTLNKSVILTDSNGIPYEDIFEECTGDIMINCPISNVDDGYLLNNGSPNDGYGTTNVFNNSKFNTITIGRDVTKIGYGYFNYVDFGRINIGDNVIEIGASAFYNASGDISFTSNSKLNKIAVYAFYGCEFNDFIMPESVTKIGWYAFSRSSGDNLIIGSKVTDIGANAFLNTNITGMVTIKCNLSNTTNISEYAFEDHQFSSLRIIGNYEKINVKMHPYAEFNNTMDKIFIEGTIKDISNTYIYINSLNELHLCESVQNISLFLLFGLNDDSVGVKKVYCAPTTPPALCSQMAFSNNTIIYVPRESVEQYKTSKNWEEYAGNIVGYDF